MNSENITLDVSGGIAKITLNRPDKLNSFDLQMHKQLAAAMMSVSLDTSVRCILITGSGRGFCAGQDLTDSTLKTPEGDMDLKSVLTQYYAPLINKIMTIDKPVICAVNGIAAGAGANIALACDIVIAAKSASFIQAFSKIGLVPDAGGTWILPRLIGHSRAAAITLLGEKISAEQAEQWGMIWKAVDDDQLIEQSEKMATQLAEGPTLALGFTKRLLQLSWKSSLDEQLAYETDFQCAAGTTEDFKEGIQAFKDKRKPNFQGK